MLYNLIFKADMISAFTQGKIDALLYLEQPEGFIDANYPDYVLKLNKALYGLKQSARIWFYTLKPKLLELGFRVLNSKACLFINNNTRVIICLYVDDLAILAPSEVIFNDFIKSIKKDFKIKNLGIIKDYLEINFNFNKDFIKLSQANYINKVLNKYNLQDAKIKSTLINSYIKLEPNKCRDFRISKDIIVRFNFKTKNK
jgi:Reverse transcriptase (RNA-dependent DNA polymerase)